MTTVTLPVSDIPKRLQQKIGIPNKTTDDNIIIMWSFSKEAEKLEVDDNSYTSGEEFITAMKNWK